MPWLAIIAVSDAVILAMAMVHYSLGPVLSYAAGLWSLFQPALLLIPKTLNQEAPLSLARQLDLPSYERQFPCQVRLSSAGRAYGTSEGILTFADGWMTFSSPEMNWSVRERDTYGCERVGHKSYLVFEFAHNDDYYRVEVYAYSSISAYGEVLEFSSTHLLECVEAWERMSPDGASLFPPIVPKNVRWGL